MLGRHILVPLHGLGGAKDLPIPAPLAVGGGAVALVVSFAVLALAWRSPRYDDPAGAPRSGVPLPFLLARLIDSTAWEWGLRALGLAMAGWFGWALVAGPDLLTNPVFGSFYVLLWVGIVPASLLFGRIFPALSPIRTLNIVLARLTGSDPSRGILTYPERWGYWPAAAGLFSLVWLELVHPGQAYLGPVRIWITAYLAFTLVGAVLFGDRWLARADPFEVYSGLLAKLSPWARRPDGTLVWRSPLANLATIVPRPGLVAVIAVLFGSTAFDSYKDNVTWARIVSKFDGDSQIPNSLALLGFCAVVGVTFTVATMSTRLDPTRRPRVTRRSLPSRFAHSVVPIIVGYMTAHYLSYFMEYGQTTLIQLSDPMVSGANLLGTANWSVNFWLSQHPSVLADVKVLAVVGGHILGVVAAHDRALSLLPRRHQVIGQLGLLIVMVAYTSIGLYLLFSA